MPRSVYCGRGDSETQAFDNSLLAAATYAPPMLDELLNLLTTHALEDMQPGGSKKTYSSKNIGGLRV
jgi:hypothetical protein